MNSFSEDFFDFIRLHAEEDPLNLRLKYASRLSPSFLDKAILQIECRKKASRKLSRFIAFPRFLFPDSISYQQATHQALAKFHAMLLKDFSSILDMTAGLGIDALTFAMAGKDVTAVELMPLKAETLCHNASVIETENFSVINADSLEYVLSDTRKFDAIFVDPARRDKSGNRVYNLHDCSPDVISNQELLLDKAPEVFIKASSLLDISQTIKDFNHIASLRAIGIKGECKEILIQLSASCPSGSKTPLLEAIDLDRYGNILSVFSGKPSTEINTYEDMKFANISDFSPSVYLLEPSAMVMKLAPWKEISRKFKAKKLDVSSHIFLAEECPADFPGRVAKVEKIITKQDRKTLSGFPASVVSRNYPLTADEIRKKYRLKEGDAHFIYATRLASKPVMILTSIQNLYPADKTI